MNNSMSKLILISAIILALISLVTSNWVKESIPGTKKSGNIGLFYLCLTNPTTGFQVCANPKRDSKIKLARDLIMLSILLLIVTLVMNYMSENNPNNEAVKMIGIVCYIIALISMIVGIVTFTKDVPQNKPNLKYSYDFSYYLAIISIVLILGAGISNFVFKK